MSFGIWEKQKFKIWKKHATYVSEYDGSNELRPLWKWKKTVQGNILSPLLVHEQEEGVRIGSSSLFKQLEGGQDSLTAVAA
jgi:hypothetical protein